MKKFKNYGTEVRREDFARDARIKAERNREREFVAKFHNWNLERHWTHFKASREHPRGR